MITYDSGFGDALKAEMLKTCNKYQYAYWRDNEADFADMWFSGKYFVPSDYRGIFGDHLDFGRQVGIQMIFDKYVKCVAKVQKQLKLSDDSVLNAMASGSESFEYMMLDR